MYEHNYFAPKPAETVQSATTQGVGGR